jgi:hypothetical protein
MSDRANRVYGIRFHGGPKKGPLAHPVGHEKKGLKYHLENSEIQDRLGTREKISEFLFDEALQLDKSRMIVLKTGDSIEARKSSEFPFPITFYLNKTTRISKAKAKKLLSGHISAIGVPE